MSKVTQKYTKISSIRWVAKCVSPRIWVGYFMSACGGKAALIMLFRIILDEASKFTVCLERNQKLMKFS